MNDISSNKCLQCWAIPWTEKCPLYCMEFENNNQRETIYKKQCSMFKEQGKEIQCIFCVAPHEEYCYFHTKCILQGTLSNTNMNYREEKNLPLLKRLWKAYKNK